MPLLRTYMPLAKSSNQIEYRLRIDFNVLHPRQSQPRSAGHRARSLGSDFNLRASL